MCKLNVIDNELMLIISVFEEILSDINKGYYQMENITDREAQEEIIGKIILRLSKGLTEHDQTN